MLHVNLNKQILHQIDTLVYKYEYKEDKEYRTHSHI